MTAVVHVRWAEPDAADGAKAWLDATERGRLARLVRAEDRDRFVTSRALLKALVASLTGLPPEDVTLAYDCAQCGRPHGRPVLTGRAATESWGVSISHAGRRVLVAAVRDLRVGVDVEPVAAVAFAGFAEVALAPAEQRALAALPAVDRQRAGAQVWARKEALLKASGSGLTVDPRDVDTTEPGVERALVDLDLGPGQAAAVAVLGRPAVRVELAGPAVIAELRREGPAAAAAQGSRATAGTAR